MHITQKYALATKEKAGSAKTRRTAQRTRHRRAKPKQAKTRRGGARARARRRRSLKNERPRQTPAGRNAARADARTFTNTTTGLDRVVGPSIAMARTAACFSNTKVSAERHAPQRHRARLTIRDCGRRAPRDDSGTCGSSYTSRGTRARERATSHWS